MAHIAGSHINSRTETEKVLHAIELLVFKLDSSMLTLTVTDSSPWCRAHLLLYHRPVAASAGRRTLVHELPRPHRDPFPADDTTRRLFGPLSRRAFGYVVVLGGCKGVFEIETL